MIGDLIPSKRRVYCDPCAGRGTTRLLVSGVAFDRRCAVCDGRGYTEHALVLAARYSAPSPETAHDRQRRQQALEDAVGGILSTPLERYAWAASQPASQALEVERARAEVLRAALDFWSATRGKGDADEQ